MSESLTLPALPGVHPRTFGHAAVDAELRRSQMVLGGTGPKDELSAARANKVVSNLLLPIREKLGKLSDSEAVNLLTFVVCVMPSEFYDWIYGVGPDAPEQNSDGVDIREWLRDQSNDSQIMNFLQWQIHDVYRLQSGSDFRQAVRRGKAQYAEGLARLIDKNIFMPTAEDAIEAVDDTPVYVADPIRAFVKGWNGFCIPSEGDIYIASPSARDKTSLEHYFQFKVPKTIRHELNHVVLGELVHFGRWIDEAVTEHIVLSMDNGRLSTIDPLSRTDQAASYPTERALLYTVMHLGGFRIPAWMATRAYSDVGAGKERDVFANEIDESWRQKTGLKDIFVLEEIRDKILCIEDCLMGDSSLSKHSKTAIQAKAVRIVNDMLKNNPRRFFETDKTRIVSLLTAQQAA